IFSPSSSRAMNLSRSSMRLHSFQGTFALPQKARLCNPCLRNELSPIPQEGHVIQDALLPVDVAKRAQGHAADFPHTLGDGVGGGEYLIALIVEQQVIVAEVRPGRVPAEVLRL